MNTTRNSQAVNSQNDKRYVPDPREIYLSRVAIAMVVLRWRLRWVWNASSTSSLLSRYLLFVIHRTGASRLRLFLLSLNRIRFVLVSPLST